MKSLLALMLITLVSFTPAFAADAVSTGLFSDVAVDGYDTVAYFTEGKPVEGSSDYEHEWNGATWRFANAANRDQFAANPEAYAPQYGGYCAWAVAQGKTAPIDPNAWKIVDDKLYLNYDQNIQAKWEQDIPGFISSADKNWPQLLAE